MLVLVLLALLPLRELVVDMERLRMESCVLLMLDRGMESEKSSSDRGIKGLERWQFLKRAVALRGRDRACAADRTLKPHQSRS